ncbi:unnamed protein product [Rotaria sp. Silwood1]|nr:unnamed protein product [Rotaria sp. Silwood1]CAF1126348.1 unnamed protein product [Rotaria sp. Silwood1]CAF4871600.1 unnamed protein product [Rotaria sp. Silwood1]
MNNPLTGILKTSYSKFNSNIRILCSVCLCYRSYVLFSTNYCCSSLKKHVQRQVCDSCVHQHILSKLYSCLASCIICPEFNCSLYLSSSAICDILLKYESNELLNDYLCEQQWQGKSDEWIKRYTLRCPGCYVPIEKTGGCDEMICIRCQTHFYWSKVKRNMSENKKQRLKSFSVIHPSIVVIIFVIFLVFLIVATVIYYK